jgi:hypothetical protein
MDDYCCVCLETSQKITNCNHNLCKKCYANMYGKKCPMCRSKIKNYKNVKKTYHKIPPFTTDDSNADTPHFNQSIGLTLPHFNPFPLGNEPLRIPIEEAIRLGIIGSPTLHFGGVTSRIPSGLFELGLLENKLMSSITFRPQPYSSNPQPSNFSAFFG